MLMQARVPEGIRHVDWHLSLNPPKSTLTIVSIYRSPTKGPWMTEREDDGKARYEPSMSSFDSIEYEGLERKGKETVKTGML